MQYCSLQHQTLLPYQSHPQLGVFALALSFHSFWSYFSTDLQEHIGHLLTWEFLFQYPLILRFHILHEVLKARILKWFSIPFSGDHILSALSIMTQPPWVAPHSMA